MELILSKMTPPQSRKKPHLTVKTLLGKPKSLVSQYSGDVSDAAKTRQVRFDDDKKDSPVKPKNSSEAPRKIHPPKVGKPAVFAQSGNATNASLKRPPKLDAKVAESFCNYHVLNDKLSEGLVPDRHFALVKSKVHMCQNSERLHLCMG